MFTIIGGDGKEYGPASVEQIRSWLAGGRASLETKAKAVGTEEWRRLGDFAEFSVEGAGVPPPIHAQTSTSGAATLELADPGIRFLSCLLDGVFGMMAAAPGAMMIGLSVLVDVIRHPADAQVEMAPRVVGGLVLLLCGALILFAVQVWLLTTRGQTLAKLIFGIHIVNHNTEANPGFVSAVILRWFVPQLITTFIPFLGGLFFLVDSCFIFRTDRRCIHDLIAGTKVVKVNR